MNRRLILLAAAATGLAVVTARDGGLIPSFGDPVPLAIQRDAPPPVTPAPAPRTIRNPLSAAAASSYGEITQRPLFNPSRAPAPPPAPEPLAPEPEPVAEAPPPSAEEINPEDFTPLAIASNDSGSTAVIRWNPTGQVFRLKQGQVMEGFEVAAIGIRDITVSRDGQSVVLKLFQQFDRTPPANTEAEMDGGAMNPTTPGLVRETSRTARPPSSHLAPKELQPTED